MPINPDVYRTLLEELAKVNRTVLPDPFRGQLNVPTGRAKAMIHEALVQSEIEMRLAMEAEERELHLHSASSLTSDDGTNKAVVSTPTGPYTIKYLLVGGGAGGSALADRASGGNGGYVTTSTLSVNPSTVYSIIIGTGGANGDFTPNNNVSAYPGPGSASTLKIGATTIASANGGGVNFFTYTGGYGGGNVNASSGPNGGNGVTSNITGSVAYYAGGGYGNNSSNGTEGLGTYGKGGNTGGYSTGHPSPGNNGVVILSIPTSRYTGTVTGSPAVSIDGAGNTILTFTGIGTYTS